jgi:Tannase and feruloyl esterase.
MTGTLRVWPGLAGVLLAGWITPASASQPCDTLRGARVGHAVVVDARSAAAGEFRQAGLPDQAVGGVAVPETCRLTVVASPVEGSRIEFEPWLPATGWNRRLKMLGNGGYSSALPYRHMAGAVAAGYAVTATDTGHKGDDPAFAIGLPQSIVDWGHRAVHETIVAAKHLTGQFYGRLADFTYFEGCSTGGQQGLMEAQRYPADFDGIVAGAPGNNRTRLNVGFLWQFVANHRADGTLILPASKLGLLQEGSLRACGTESERTRGFLENPLSCRFDPADLVCTNNAASDCLTTEEAAAARRLYAGARNPRTGAQIYPPWPPGSEVGWSLYWADPRDPRQPARANFFRFWAFGDPGWDWRSFDFDRSMRLIDPKLMRAIDAVEPDLSRFARGGGKLIIYQGLADPVVSPHDTVRYFDRIWGSGSIDTADFARLFLVPGMAHCGGGPGAIDLKADLALEAWVERGMAPELLPATEATQLAPPLGICARGRAGDECRRNRR